MTLRLLAFGPRSGESDETLLYLDRSDLEFGKEIEVSIGPADAAQTVFKGRISAIEAEFAETREPEVVIYAEDRLMDLRMTRRMKTYENVSDAQIAQQIATEHGLSAQADAQGPTYDVVQQFNTSDLAFLRERAALIQAEVWVDGTTLHFQSRSGRQAGQLTLVQGNDLVHVQVRADLAHQRTSVGVCGYDASAREQIYEEAAGDAVQSEASSGETGPAVLQRVLGRRASYRVLEAPLIVEEARQFARAEMLRRARQFVVAAGSTTGTPAMTVGSRLRLERIGGPFEGDGYYVTHVCHTYDLQSGYRTQFEAQRASVGGGA
jgi:phage protein D